MGQAPAPTAGPPQLPVPPAQEGARPHLAPPPPLSRPGSERLRGSIPKQPSPTAGRPLPPRQPIRARAAGGPPLLARWRARGAGPLPGPSQWRATSGVGPAWGEKRGPMGARAAVAWPAVGGAAWRPARKPGGGSGAMALWWAAGGRLGARGCLGVARRLCPRFRSRGRQDGEDGDG